MTTYYVAGSMGPLGTGDGSSEANAALSDNGLTLVNGDTVLYLRGSTTRRNSGDGDFTGLDDLTFSDYGDDDDAKPIIDCNEVDGLAGICIDGDGCVIENLSVRDWDTVTAPGEGIKCSTATNTIISGCEFESIGTGNAIGANDGVSPPLGGGTELTGNVITGCVFDGFQGDGFTTQGNTSWTISGCTFLNLTGTLTDAIAAHAAPGANFVVENCFFSNISGKSVLDLKDCNATIRRNIFVNNTSPAAISIRRDVTTVYVNDPANPLPDRMGISGAKAVIEDNVIYIPNTVGAVAAGIAIGDGGWADIRHNTIINAGTAESAGNRPACISSVDGGNNSPSTPGIIEKNLCALLGTGYMTVIGGRVTTGVGTITTTGNLFATDGATHFAIYTSNDPTPDTPNGPDTTGDPTFAVALNQAGYGVATSGAESTSIISATTFAGGASFEKRSDFRPLTGDAIDGKNINYGARIKAWVLRHPSIPVGALLYL